MADYCEVCNARRCMLREQARLREAREARRLTHKPSKKELRRRPSRKEMRRLWSDAAMHLFDAGQTVKDLRLEHHDVITVDPEWSVERGLQTLIDHHISSAPVVGEEGGEPLGFLDMNDLLRVIVQANTIAGDTDTDAFGDLRALLTHVDLASKKIRDVYGVSHMDPYLPLEERSPLLQVACILGDSVHEEEGGPAVTVHRIPILDPEQGGKVIKIVSQSAMLNYLHDNHEHLESILHAMVMDCCGVGTDKELYTAKADDPALHSLAKILEHDISGLPIVDEDDRLVGHVSNFDPACLLAVKSDLRLASMTTLQLAQAAHKVRFPEEATTKRRRKKPLGLAGAVTVSRHATLAHVLHALVTHHVHRVFVVDKHHRPVGLISGRDLLRELVVKFQVPTELRSSLARKVKGGKGHRRKGRRRVKPFKPLPAIDDDHSEEDESKGAEGADAAEGRGAGAGGAGAGSSE